MVAMSPAKWLPEWPPCPANLSPHLSLCLQASANLSPCPTFSSPITNFWLLYLDFLSHKSQAAEIKMQAAKTWNGRGFETYVTGMEMVLRDLEVILCIKRLKRYFRKGSWRFCTPFLNVHGKIFRFFSC